MKIDANLSEFNRHFADALLPTFPPDVKALQSADGTLLFRGPVPASDGQTHIGTHVALALDHEVKVALSEATPLDRIAMMEILVSNLGTQIQTQYDSTKIGQFALEVVGTMRILRG
jgi:hypothetical protein